MAEFHLDVPGPGFSRSNIHAGSLAWLAGTPTSNEDIINVVNSSLQFFLL